MASEVATVNPGLSVQSIDLATIMISTKRSIDGLVAT